MAEEDNITLKKKNLLERVSFSDQQALEKMVKDAPKEELEYYWIKHEIRHRGFPWLGLFVMLFLLSSFFFLGYNVSIDKYKSSVLAEKICVLSGNGNLLYTSSSLWNYKLDIACENATIPLTKEYKAAIVSN